MSIQLMDLMRQATRLTRPGNLGAATEAIVRALNGSSIPMGPPGHPLAGDMSEDAGSALIGPFSASMSRADAETLPPIRPQSGQSSVQEADGNAPDEGAFTGGEHRHASHTRGFKLYIPPGNPGYPRPLVVMLHGCTQDPDDFASGTGMNQLGREQDFFVLYPAQSRSANPSRCWNWFNHEHQQREGGEPALLASMTQAVMARHGIDPRRVYIAGLSAGGAMAAIVASAYPEIFAAVGVHSGLPCGAASDVAGALMVMKSGIPAPGVRTQGSRVGFARPTQPRPTTVVPTIVFHGDQDRTVHPRNGEQVIAAALGSAADAGRLHVEQGVSDMGRRYTRSTHPTESGAALAEHWVVHGAGHAWSGGHAKGSYTDGTGPDASREMLRFFFEHPLGPAH